jgi:hypothetical protein
MAPINKYSKKKKIDKSLTTSRAGKETANLESQPFLLILGPFHWLGKGWMDTEPITRLKSQIPNPHIQQLQNMYL